MKKEYRVKKRRCSPAQVRIFSIFIIRHRAPPAQRRGRTRHHANSLEIKEIFAKVRQTRVRTTYNHAFMNLREFTVMEHDCKLASRPATVEIR